MPFGAAVDPAGGVRFRLWAPALDRVTLRLLDPDGDVAMTAAGDGWFEQHVPHAHAGSRYRYVLPDGRAVPDPASRHQPDDVHGPSVVVDPEAFVWDDTGWRGRSFEEAVFYELHVGTFTAAGTFAAAIGRLEALARLGVTAIELMPLADAPGARGWGYDGVCPFAPEARYGPPDDLKRLVVAAHARGLMVFVDVVYNHFGPDGNYLGAYAPQFFTDRHETPWGAAIDFESPASRPVRDWVIHNALYWLEEFHVDGLRLDAVHAIHDASTPHVLDELADTVRTRCAGRRVHLVLENDDNAIRWLESRDDDTRRYDAQWNDDLHHAFHVLLTGERDGYYADYADAPLRHLGRALAEGFAWQGQVSGHRGGPRGEPSAHLSPTAFVGFLQNHDQIGNRAFGDRLTTLATPRALRAAVAVLLLAPSPPLLFMGEEWGCTQPFPFFCDFGGDLADAVRTGRRAEFARFPAFRDPAAQARIPDPCSPDTFASAVLRWADADTAAGRGWFAFYRALLTIRRRTIVPRLRGMEPHAGSYTLLDAGGLRVIWALGDGSRLTLLANLSGEAVAAAAPPAPLLWITPRTRPRLLAGTLPQWSVAWFLSSAVPPS